MMAKELSAGEFLVKAFGEYIWTFNKTWKGRQSFTSRRRPDAHTGVFGRVVIVEVDEHSHATYECEKERAREEAFVRSARSADRELVMIRINPDGYTDEAGKYHPTCFRYNATSFQTTVDPKHRTQWQTRLEKLSETVAYYLDTSNRLPAPQFGRPCYTVELFYADVAGNAAKKRSRAEQ